MDIHSPRSSALKAQVSTTWEPCVLITVTLWPRPTRAALPLRAGISTVSVCIQVPPHAPTAPGPLKRASLVENLLGGRRRTRPLTPFGCSHTSRLLDPPSVL